MKILGIETSCDETAAAVVENGTKILSNIVATSSEMHTKTGGIIPEQAARQQVLSILPVVQNAMLNAKCPAFAKASAGRQMASIDAIAVTVGPGLIGSLLVGVETAKTLSYLWKKPIIPVNHLVAHIYANWLDKSGQWTVNGVQKNTKELTEHRTLNTEHKTPQFPALALVVSGGHTDLVLIKSHGKLRWIGGTRDDAAGEAFDKCARLLGLPYPGGQAIAKEAEKFLEVNQAIKLNKFPRPMLEEENYDWSFSGLKTAVLRRVKEQESKRVKVNTPRFAAEVQEAIVDVLVAKSLRAIKKYRPKSFLLAGGVAANTRLREKFQKSLYQLTKSLNHSVNFFVPSPKLCTDNAAYVASCAFFNNSALKWSKIVARPELTIADQL